MSTDHLIELVDVTRSDPTSGQTILDQISVTVDRGERVGLVGPSGSGKTTLLRALAKLDPYHQGMLRFDGQPIWGDRVPQYRRQVIYLSQHPAFVDGTVTENLSAPFRFSGSQSDLDLSLVKTWLDQLGKPVAMLSQTIDTLSGGEQQLVSLIRALALSPTVLLLDEPSAALDADTTSQLERLVSDWQRSLESRALVWSSHDPEQVDRMTTRRIEINQGRLADGEAK